MAMKPFNSVPGFSVGKGTKTVIYGNGDVSAENLLVANIANLGNVGNVIISGGTSGQIISTDGMGNLTFIDPSSSQLSNGNSNVQVLTDGNITFSVSGNANVAVITGSGIDINGYVNSASVIRATSVYANSGTISAQTLKGEGGNVSNIQGANVAGAVAFATTANSVSGANVTGTVSSATTAGTVTTNAQPNITSIGTLTSLSVAGNSTSGNFVGRLANGNSNVNIPIANGNVNISAAGNANILVVTGTGVNVNGTLNSTGNANVGNLGATGAITASGNVSGANLVTGGSLTVTGNANVGNVGATVGEFTGNVIAGNVYANSGTLGANTLIIANNASISGNLAMSNKNITGVAEPVNPQDAATKNYVDTVAQGLHVHAPCTAATPNTLATITGGTVTYNNGTSGVGATLTTTGTYTTIDGINVATVGTRILVKNEANTAWNGIYTYTSSTVITRATDFDTPTEMAGGDFTFVTSGTLYNDTGWVLTDPVTTIGTTPVTFAQFSGAGTYTAGTGLTLTGTVFSITNTAVTAGSYGNGDRVATFTVNGQGQLTAASNVAITANAANLTGTTLSPTIVNSSLTSVGTLGSLTVTGKVTSGQLQGEGGNISNIQGANILGAVASATSATTAGTVTTNAQPNITSVGTLTSLNVTGNANVGNLGTAQVLATSNITAPQFISNIATGTAPFVVTSTTQVANLNAATAGTAVTATSATNASALLQNTSTATTVYPTFTTSSANGNSSAVINTGISANLANASITATTFVGALSGAATSATTAGTVTTNAQPNITSVGTLTSLGVNGTVTAVAFTANTGVFTGNGNGLSSIQGANVTGAVAFATTANSVAGANVSGQVNFAAVANSVAGANVSGTVSSATTAGTVTTNAQPNITSVGTLTSLNVNGISNLGSVSNLIITGGSAGQYLQTNGSGGLSWQTVSGGGGGASISNGTSNVNIATSGGEVTTSVAGNANIQIITGTGVNVNGTLNSTGNANVGNLGAAQVLATSNITAPQLISNVATGTAPFVVTSTTQVANLNAATAGTATTAGTVTTNAQPNITSVGTLTSLAVTGNITGGNLIGPHANGNSNVDIPTANGNVNISAAGNANILVVTGTGANIAGTLQVSGVSNLGPNGNVVITGGTNGQVLTTNGSGGLSWTTVSGGGASIANGTSNVNIPVAGGNINASVNGNVNILVITDTGVNVTGTINSTGNITAQSNILVTGSITRSTSDSNITIAPTGTGVVDVSGKKISNVGTPTSSTDSATKGYVDTAVSLKIDSNTAPVSGSNAITNIIRLTQAQYDGIGSPSSSTMYVIVG